MEANTEQDDTSGNLPGKGRDNMIVDAILKFADRWFWSQKERYKKSKLFPFAFQVNDAHLIKMESRVLNQFSKIAPTEEPNIIFNSEVRFQDLTTINFDNLKELLDKAGDQNDPESIKLKWHVFIPNPYPVYAEIEASYSTEKPLNVEELGLLEYHVASMQLTVAGHTPEWIDVAFKELEPFMTSVKLGGIYKILLIFRNKSIVNLMSNAMGVLSYITYITVGGNIRSVNKNPKREELMNKILSQPTIESKFNEYVKNEYAPSVSSPVFDNIIYFSGSIIVWITAVVIFMALLPKLVPKSGINIGLSKTRFETYENTFKLIIFTVVLSGILIPLFRKIFGF